jgi:hypothetical protein
MIDRIKQRNSYEGKGKGVCRGHRGHNPREAHIKKLAIDKGYEVLRSGWPDFLLYKASENKAVFLEVKSKDKTGKRLNPAQKRMAEILKKLGLNWQVVYVINQIKIVFGH